MNSLRYQRTIARAAHVRGFGYWSGQDVSVQFHPAPPDTGIVFVRTDLAFPGRVTADVERRVEVPRRTNLTQAGVTVEMVEHVLAALSGLRIDNCEVRVDQAELPGCDGSSQSFVDALLGAGVREQTARRSRLRVTHPVRVGDDQAWVEALPVDHDGCELRYELDYADHAAIGRQAFELRVTPDSFRHELAAARTFLLQREADWLRAQGLGRRVTPHDLLVFGSDGPIDNSLRFPDECVRHKALDMVGDLALLGCDLVGRVVASRSGHRLNAQLVRALRGSGRWETDESQERATRSSGQRRSA